MEIVQEIDTVGDMHPIELSGLIESQLEGPVEGLKAEIRAAWNNQRKGFWLGLGAGAVIVLSARYIFQKEL